MKFQWQQDLDKVFAALTIVAQLIYMSYKHLPGEEWVVLLLAISTLITEFVKPKLKGSA